MTKPWSREYAESDRPAFEDTIEVPLDDDLVAPTTSASDTPPSPAARWRPGRALLGLSAAAVIAAAAVTIVVVGSGGHEADETTAPATTLDPFLLSDSITTPPTLGPLDTPASTAAPTTSIAVQAQPAPEFESVPDVDAAELARYDLAIAVEHNTPSADAMRTIFEIARPREDPIDIDPEILDSTVSIVVASDPGAQLDSLTVESGDSVSRSIVDRAASRVYTSTPALPQDRWAQFSESEVIDGSGTATLGELFDALVTGPITAELMASASVTPSDGLVRLGGGAIARRYDLDVAIGAIDPPGVLLLLAPPGQLRGADGSTTVELQVYVTSQPALALVTGTFQASGRPLSFVQMFDRRPANVRIDVPTGDQLIPARDPRLGEDGNSTVAPADTSVEPSVAVSAP
jgi:hypothetical protein